MPSKVSKATCKKSSASQEAARKRKLKEAKKKIEAEREAQREAAARRHEEWPPAIVKQLEGSYLCLEALGNTC